MNLRYTLPLTLLVAGTSMAQWATPRPSMIDLRPADERDSRQSTLPLEVSAATDRDGGDVVFYEDFANGLAGNNGVGAWTTAGANGNIWKRAVSGPLGAFTAVGERIQSQTVANGYMLFNADSANCTWSGNTPTALPTAQFTAWEGSLVSPVLDLSATPYVELTFQQRLRYCCSSRPHFVEVSTDGGASWPFSYPTSLNAVINSLTATETISINLVQAIQGDPTNVRFRFRHNAEAGTSHYIWQIDDVRIVELFNYDLRMNSAAVTQFNINTAATYDSIRYSLYPYNQLRPLGLNMTVLNNGSATQETAVANFTVTRGGTTVLDQDQPLGSFPPGAQQTIFVNPDFTPPAVAGTYNVAFSIGSDEPDANPNDNTATGSFGVAEHIYARDNGTVASFTDGDGQGGTLILCNAFYVANTAQLSAIPVALRSGTEVGSIIQGELRADNLDDILGLTEEVIIAANMLNGANGSNFLNLVFDPPITVDAGQDYMACVQAYGNIRIGQNGVSEPQTSFIFFDGPSGINWYFTTTTPMIRMSFDPSVGITEADRIDGMGLGQNFPNPANATTTIPFELDKATDLTFQVHDMSGKLVMEQVLGTRGAGPHRIELETRAMQSGVYFYTLAGNDVRQTKRMTVIH
jgi:hypothetical protein